MGNTDASLNPPPYQSQKNGMNNRSSNNIHNRYDLNNNMNMNINMKINMSPSPPGPNQQQLKSQKKRPHNDEMKMHRSYDSNANNSMENHDHGSVFSHSEYAALEIFNSEAMNVCWVFWKDNVDILPRNKQKELALLLYCHMFQKIPNARRLFIRGEIDEQALKFLDMFGYLIRQLKDYENQTSLLKTMTSLGTRHSDWGVRAEYFEPMLNSLHGALSDHFKHTYTVRVKFCMEQIFTSAANIMTGEEINNVFTNRYQSQSGGITSGNLAFLQSLEHCLADETGKEYLNRFLIQSFCAELVEFETYYKRYKGSLSDTERYIVSQSIVKQFLTPNAKNELNIKYDSRSRSNKNNKNKKDDVDIKHKVLKKIDKIQNNKGSSKKSKNSEYPPDLFDPIHFWVMNQIENNSWPKFKQTIQSITVHNGGGRRGNTKNNHY